MSVSLSAVEQIEYDALVKAEYRSRGFLLRDAVRMKQNVIGATCDFRKVGQIIAVQTGYQQAVTAQDPGYTKSSATLNKYTAPIAIDSVQELTVNFDSKMESAMLVADAMGRRSDQICIDALDADPGATIANGGTNFTYAKYTQVVEQFEDNAVPPAERYVAMSASNFRALLAAQEFTNLDYTSNRVLDKGWAVQYLGFNLIIVPSMSEGGLPLAGSIRTALAWHKMAIGMAVSHDFRTEINYLPEKTSWLCNGVFSAGAVVIDNRGVVAIDCDETA
jgi:Tfp pilus assembly protein PilV